MVRRICDELVKAKIFILNIRDLSKTVSAPARSVLERLGEGNIRVNLTAGAAFLEELAGQNLDIRTIRKFFIEEGTPFFSENLLERMRETMEAGVEIGLSFPLDELTFRKLPDAVSFCIRNRIRHLDIPIQSPNNGSLFRVDSKDAQWLSGELEGIQLEHLNLSIHDPLLWKVFHRKDNPNESGCNGARTMIYISEDLDVTPARS